VLNFIVNDGQGNPVDLSGATFQFLVQQANDPTGTNLPVSGAVTVDNAAEGMCHYTVAEGDFVVPGKYLAQLVILGTGSQVTAPGIVIQVIPSLPQENN
jgi:hypothetical protein